MRWLRGTLSQALRRIERYCSYCLKIIAFAIVVAAAASNFIDLKNQQANEQHSVIHRMIS